MRRGFPPGLQITKRVHSTRSRKFTSCFPMVGGSLRLLLHHKSWSPWYSWYIAKSGPKTPKVKIKIKCLIFIKVEFYFGYCYVIYYALILYLSWVSIFDGIVQYFVNLLIGICVFKQYVCVSMKVCNTLY